MRSLATLNLADNELSGAIPHTINELRNLRVVLIHNNQFTGSIPQKLLLQRPMMRAQLDGNMFDATVDADQKKMISLGHFPAPRVPTHDIVVPIQSYDELERLIDDPNILSSAFESTTVKNHPLRVLGESVLRMIVTDYLIQHLMSAPDMDLLEYRESILNTDSILGSARGLDFESRAFGIVDTSDSGYVMPFWR